ncbi:MAG TPA: glycosyltransferase family 4 protein [Clostridia bacterium]|nr:glycosyltransferase family 4 protein [Clostridia bacterium]
MKIALCHFRVGETDGVSLEMEKWKTVLEKKGHEVFFLAGSQGRAEAYIIPELHYLNEDNNRYVRNAYEALTDYENEPAFKAEVLSFAARLEAGLESFIKHYGIEMLVINNIWSLGWGLPAALAFDSIVRKHRIPCVAHHHDFYWERERYSRPTCGFVRECLDNCFPPRHELVRHVVINRIAALEMKRRKGMDTVIVPNVFDFEAPVWSADDYNKDFRERIGLKDNDLLVLQATRIERRKAIELAVDVVGELGKPGIRKWLEKHGLYDGRSFESGSRIVLVLAGLKEAEVSYIEALKDRALKKGVELLFINDVIEHSRCNINGRKCYSLWDAYVFADLITYPSILEGWGNQLLEGFFSKKPIVVYEYPVFETDIKEKGFGVISLGSSHRVGEDGLAYIEDAVISAAAEECMTMLTDKKKRTAQTETNFQLGREHFSYESLLKSLSQIFDAKCNKQADASGHTIK